MKSWCQAQFKWGLRLVSLFSLTNGNNSMMDLFCPNCASYLGPYQSCCSCGWARLDADRQVPTALAWSKPATLSGSPRGQPLIFNELILFAWGSPRRGGGVTALQREDGKIRWQIELDFAVTGIAAEQGRIYFGTTGLLQKGARLYCCNPDTQIPEGEILWKESLPGGVWDAPTVADTRVYAACDDGSLVCLDIRTGAPVPGWPVKVEAGPSWLIESGNQLIVISKTGKILQVDPIHGSRSSPLTLEKPISARPVIHNTTLYAGCQDGSLIAISLLSRKRSILAQDLKQIVAQPILADDRLWVGAHDYLMHAYDLKIGKELWRSQPCDRSISSTAAIGNDLVVFGSNDGSIYAVREIDGEPFWRYKTSQGRPVTGSVAFAKDVFYVANIDGEVFSINWHLGQYEAAGRHLEMLGRSLDAIPYYLLAAETEQQNLERKQRCFRLAQSLMKKNGRYEWKANLNEVAAIEAPEMIAQDLERAAELKSVPEQSAILFHRAAGWYEEAQQPARAETCRLKAIRRARAPYLTFTSIEIPHNCRMGDEVWIAFKIQNLGNAPARNVRMRVAGNLKVPYIFDIGHDFSPQCAPVHVEIPVTPTSSGNLILEVFFSDDHLNQWSIRRIVPWTVRPFEGIDINGDVGSLVLNDLPKEIRINGMVGLFKVRREQPGDFKVSPSS